MVTTDLGACEWFIWDLRRSNLIDRGRLDPLVHDFLKSHPGAEPPSLAEHLVKHGLLTQFQCERLLQGKTQGFVLGPFTLLDALGTGSMGTVYKATSKKDGGTYAVKVLPRRSMWNVRIARRKLKSFELCNHPAIVPFVDVGTAGGTHYLAWPFIEGQTLEQHVIAEGKLEPAEVSRIALQLLEALASCHEQGLIHGLLKPSNLMLTESGDARILDFGIGCLLAEAEGESLVDTMSTANSVSNGLDCCSPESILDPTNISPAGDQYSLGCVMYYCLTGRYPFPDGSAVEKMMAHQTKDPAPLSQLNPEIPAALAAQVERMMAKQPEARFPGAQAAATALLLIAEGQTATKKSSQKSPVHGSGYELRGTRSGEHPTAASLRDTVRRSDPSVHDTPAPHSRSTPPLGSPRAASPSSQAAAKVLPTRESVMGRAQPVSRQLRKPAPQPSQRAATAPKESKKLGAFGLMSLALLVCILVWLFGRMLF